MHNMSDCLLRVLPGVYPHTEIWTQNNGKLVVISCYIYIYMGVYIYMYYIYIHNMRLQVFHICVTCIYIYI